MIRAHPALLVALLLLAACGGGGGGAGTTEPEPTEVFSFVVLADPHLFGSAEAETRLAACVTWIEANRVADGIELVLVVGDMGSRRDDVTRVLDGLSIPWVPLIGDNALQALEEEAFHTAFDPQHQILAGALTGWEKAATPVTDPATDGDLWLQNMAFEHRGVHFVCLDWCTRVIGGTPGEQADLHDFAGGTWPWFRDQITARATGPEENVVLLSHHPMHDWLLGLGAFSSAEMATIEAFTAPHADHIYASLAGHYHIDQTQGVSSGGFEVHVTDATWDDDDTLRLITVSSNGSRFTYAHDLVVVPWQ